MRDFQGEMFGRQTVPGKVRGKCPGKLSLGKCLRETSTRGTVCAGKCSGVMGISGETCDGASGREGEHVDSHAKIRVSTCSGYDVFHPS